MDVNRFRVTKSEGFDLSSHPADYTANYTDKTAGRADLKKNIKRLQALQHVLYAHNKHALLIIFQAMDAAGKDGAIRHVMSGLNPQGTQVFSFKKPSEEELDHDYLWRCVKALPERGRIGIFNRSYYEDVLIVRVHPKILESKRIPDDRKKDPNLWQQRFGQMRALEKHLVENGTEVLKFFLNVSKQEQKERFLARINTPEKNWKFSTADAEERKHWDRYMHAYSEAIAHTSTPDAPWYVLPADKKWFTRLAVSEIVAQKLESMGLSYPSLSDEHMEDLAEAKKMLEQEEA